MPLSFRTIGRRVVHRCALVALLLPAVAQAGAPVSAEQLNSRIARLNEELRVRQARELAAFHVVLERYRAERLEAVIEYEGAPEKYLGTETRATGGPHARVYTHDSTQAYVFTAQRMYAEPLLHNQLLMVAGSVAPVQHGVPVSVEVWGAPVDQYGRAAKSYVFTADGQRERYVVDDNTGVVLVCEIDRPGAPLQRRFRRLMAPDLTGLDAKLDALIDRSASNQHMIEARSRDRGPLQILMQGSGVLALYLPLAGWFGFLLARTRSRRPVPVGVILLPLAAVLLRIPLVMLLVHALHGGYPVITTLLPGMLAAQLPAPLQPAATLALQYALEFLLAFLLVAGVYVLASRRHDTRAAMTA